MGECSSRCWYWLHDPSQPQECKPTAWSTFSISRKCSTRKQLPSDDGLGAAQWLWSNLHTVYRSKEMQWGGWYRDVLSA
jgi:hypothetical protein